MIDLMGTHTLNKKNLFFLFSFIFSWFIFSQQSEDYSYLENTIQLEIHNLVNEERTNHSLSPLKWDEKLAQLAKSHSIDMARNNFLSHINKNGLDPSQRAEKLGISCGKNYGDEVKIGVGENILQNALYIEKNVNGTVIVVKRSAKEIAETTVEKWLQKKENKENILDKEYVSEGIGVSITEDGRVYITQNLCIGSFSLNEKNALTLDIEKIKRRIHNLVNLERKKWSLKELKWNEKLATLAKSHSEDMAENKYFSHINKNGEDPTKRAVRMGIEIKKVRGNTVFTGIGENIFKNSTYSKILIIDEKEFYEYNDEEEIARTTVKGWMESEGHKENILNKNYEEEGIGIAINNDGEVYITENFF